MIGTSSCRMIWAVMYGYTPIARIEKLEIVPPESRSSKVDQVSRRALHVRKLGQHGLVDSRHGDIRRQPVDHQQARK